MKTKAKQRIERLIARYNEIPSKDRQEWLFGAISFVYDIDLISSVEAAAYCRECGLIASACFYDRLAKQAQEAEGKQAMDELTKIANEGMQHSCGLYMQEVSR